MCYVMFPKIFIFNMHGVLELFIILIKRIFETTLQTCQLHTLSCVLYEENYFLTLHCTPVNLKMCGEVRTTLA